MKKLAFLLSLTVLTTLTSCAGYHTGASRPAKMSGVMKLEVPTFKNDTLEPRLEVLATNALIKKLQEHGTYKIVETGEGDARLEATIIDIERGQFRSVRSNTLRTSELLMRLRIDFKVVNTTGEELLEGQSRGESNIVIDPNTQLTERQALADATERLSIDLASQLTEGW